MAGTPWRGLRGLAGYAEGAEGLDHAGQRPAGRANAVDRAGDLPLRALGHAGTPAALAEWPGEPAAHAAAPGQRHQLVDTAGAEARDSGGPDDVFGAQDLEARAVHPAAGDIGVQRDEPAQPASRVQGTALPGPAHL